MSFWLIVSIGLCAGGIAGSIVAIIVLQSITKCLAEHAKNLWASQRQFAEHCKKLELQVEVHEKLARAENLLKLHDKKEKVGYSK